MVRGSEGVVKMYLSYQKLSDMGEKIFSDFNYFFFGRSFDQKRDYVLPMMIDRFAKDYLGLNVEFARLSDDGSICGLTAYADTEYKADGKVLPLWQNKSYLMRALCSPAWSENFAKSGDLPLPMSALIRYSFDM